MKGYILLDIPESCGPACEIYESCRQRFSPCPIKPLPEKKLEIDGRCVEEASGKVIGVIRDKEAVGWNACIDAITREGE